jgi:hypothetical protein
VTAARKTKPKRRKVAPCKACKGYTVPARKVPKVARDARGRFKRTR